MDTLAGYRQLAAYLDYLDLIGLIDWSSAGIC